MFSSLWGKHFGYTNRPNVKPVPLLAKFRLPVHKSSEFGRESDGFSVFGPEGLGVQEDNALLRAQSSIRKANLISLKLSVKHSRTLCCTLGFQLATTPDLNTPLAQQTTVKDHRKYNI